MENFTIHVFGYGETQINSKDLSIKVATDTLTNVKPLLDVVFSKKPKDDTTSENSTLNNVRSLFSNIFSKKTTNKPASETDFHAVNFFGYKNVRWMSKESFELKDDADLKPLIDALISELQIAKDNQTQPTQE